jgi:hypothetical protein
VQKRISLLNNINKKLKEVYWLKIIYKKIFKK